MSSNHIKPYQQLAYAIIYRAADDYKDALRILHRRRTDRPRSHAEIVAQHVKTDCERFFKSSYFELISEGVSGEYVMKMLKQEFEEEEAAIARGEKITRKHRTMKA